MLVFDIETTPAVPLDSRIAAMAEKRNQSPEMFASLCPALCKVVCIGASTGEKQGIWFDESVVPTYSRSETYSVFPCGSEAAMLDRLSIRLATETTLVTFNGRGFDIPVLLHRYKAHGLKAPEILIKAAYQKPWEYSPHIDMLNVLTFGGAGQKYSLQAYAIGAGIEDPKQDGAGGNVQEMLADGSVLRYCVGDVVATVELWRKWCTA